MWTALISELVLAAAAQDFFLSRHATASVDSPRTRTLLDAGWKFQFETSSSNDDCTFEDKSGVQCVGLTFNAAGTVDWPDYCQQACCNDPSCLVWQWIMPSDANHTGCWLGDSCDKVEVVHDWVGGIRPKPGPPAGDCSEPICQSDFDDEDWRTLSLPHDFVVEGDVSKDADEAHGFLPYGTAWYRLRFHVPASAKGSALWVDFDGVQKSSITYLNGKYLGTHSTGYSTFRYAIEDSAIYGEENVLAVRVDASGADGWWYDGGGIYRHVWLNQASSLHVAPWGVYLPAQVTSEISSDELADAEVQARIMILNDGLEKAEFSVRSLILDMAGNVVADVTSRSVKLEKGSNTTVEQTVPMQEVMLWSPGRPALYTCETSVVVGGADVRDMVTDTFGVRKMHWDKDLGFFLNDKPTKIFGMANHQDFAGVGVAVPDSVQTYRVSTLKRMGANAWRTAHNPPTAALLDECDRQGLLVWDENHRNNDSPQQLQDMRMLLLRDRNHPSVIMWSVCNEALCEQYRPSTAQVLKDIERELDPDGQRVVSAAENAQAILGDAFSQLLDVQGINYQVDKYDTYHAQWPEKPIIGSEVSAEYGDRGVYSGDTKHAYISAYDVDSNHEDWGYTAEDAWCAILDRDFVAGGFTWTAFDYKGEPDPTHWPTVNSHFGAIDIAGFPKDNFYYYQSIFKRVEEEPILHVFPHWNWGPEHNLTCTGRCRHQDGKKMVNVWAYTNFDDVELFLNGRSLGRKAKSAACRHVEWDVPYEAGTLQARAYKQGHSDLTVMQHNTGPAVRVLLSVEWPSAGSLQADGVDTALVTASLVDSLDGALVVPTAAAPLAFALRGPGRILGVGNGDPSSHERDAPDSDASAKRTAWNGLARVLVQASREAGEIVLTAEADGLQGSSVTIATRAA